MKNRQIPEQITQIKSDMNFKMQEESSIAAGFKRVGRRSTPSIMLWPLACLMGNCSQNLSVK
jgi:hypothetical protein